ncbi:uncharacterized protein LOC128553426 [Mercenaria mercenaria]|uniref:uncharacterized protein LOC128553426 n=1 Tax=Mercenaria mercenaria TaxID=6596 RepID=UPI00234E37DA|nr:uncharacterized protein LOC128553426 [Mercenaria mercenaria]
MKLKLWIVLTAFTQSLQRSDGFLIADYCIAPPPCTCSESGTATVTVECASKGLTTTPDMKHLDTHIDTFNILLSDNQLKTVPENAFKNLSNINASSINIDLSGNGMQSLNSKAFIGIENVITSLNLKTNNLSSIPEAVGKLRALKSLDITDNPLRSLGFSVMSNVGHSLQILKVDLELFSTWPDEIGLLHSLTNLYIQTIPFTSLRFGIFHSFEHTLKFLYIEKATNLENIPFAVCQLTEIQSLTMNWFTKISKNDSSLFELCKENRHSLTNLSLGYSLLSIFPDVFHLYPMLSELSLSTNRLEIIKSEVIPNNTSLLRMTLDGNSFKRIPAALNKLNNLHYLNINSNDIIAVEDNDLIGLSNLEILDLSVNPIRYISDKAFESTTKLNTLYLQKTKLQLIPLAVTTLPWLSNLDIRSTKPILCTCDLSYLKYWNASSVQSFHGQCAYSTLSFQKFITTFLQNCP